MTDQEKESLNEMIAKAQWNVDYHQGELNKAKAQLKILKKVKDGNTKN